MTSKTNPLAGDFESPSVERWEAEILKVLNRRRPPGKELTLDKALARITTKTIDGLTINPLYLLPEGGQPSLGAPGVMPYTRGTKIRTGDPVAWDVCQMHEDPDISATHKHVMADLERGATSVWVRLDDDAIPAEKLSEVFDGVLPELAPLRVSSYFHQEAAAESMLEFWSADGLDRSKLIGNFGIDSYAFLARSGESTDLSLHTKWVRIAADFPEVRALTADVTVYHDAGASDVDELAFAIATGIDYVRHLVADGIEPATAFAQLLFRVSATNDQFLTIARLRALRRLWARVGEVLQVPADKRGALQHAVSSLRMMTRDDPYVNMLRTTVAGFAAAAGGADIVTVLPFDAANGLPDEFSRRIARNTQVILSEESNIGRVNDPGGGSWYIESLTDQIAEASWKVVQQIEAAGGMGEALASGMIADRIETTNEARAHKLAHRKQQITGVSMFPMRGEQPIDVKPRPERRPFKFRVRRDSEVFEGLRDRSINHEAKTGSKPQVFLAGIGTRRDFGARLTFVENLLGVAGLDLPTSESPDPAEHAKVFTESGAKIAVICSSPKVYAEHGVAVAEALRDAGAEQVYLAGQLKELGEIPEGLISGNVFDGMDVVAFLANTLDTLEVAR